MCYSANASLVALLLGTAGQIVLWKQNNPQSRALAIGLIPLTAMQAFEYVMWKNPCSSTSPNITNQNVSRLAMISNFSQPLVISACLLWIHKKTANQSKALIVGTIAYAVLLVSDVSNAWPQVTCSSTAGSAANGQQCTSNNCGLEWQWVEGFSRNSWWAYFILLHVSVLSLLKPTSTALISLGFIDITFALSMGLHSKERSVGSHWCFYAVALPWILAALPQQKYVYL
jgi:hypothetical protein